MRFIFTLWLALLALTSPAYAQVVASDDFSTPPTYDRYSACLQPWENALSQCSQIAMGGGDALMWSNQWGGSPPWAWVPGRLVMYAAPMTSTQLNLIQKQLLSQTNATAATKANILATKFYTSALLTRQTFSAGTRVSGKIAPGVCPTTWDSGGVLYAQVADRQMLGEIDFGEIDCKVGKYGERLNNGTVRITSAIHWRTGPGQPTQTLKCPQIVKRQLMETGVTRVNGQVIFDVNGKETCRFDAPPIVMNPMMLYLAHTSVGANGLTNATFLGWSVTHVER